MGCITCSMRKKLNEQEKKTPGLMDMAANVTMSALNVLKTALRTGKVLADKEIIEDRVKKCKDCSFLRGNRCMSCGCFVSIKAGLKSEKCPEGKW
jgi:hypothetical protein